MEAIVRKWGNSLGIRVPSHIARKLKLKDGSCVDISDRENEIIIKPDAEKIKLWFNVITPKNRDLNELKKELLLLANKKWWEIYT